VQSLAPVLLDAIDFGPDEDDAYDEAPDSLHMSSSITSSSESAENRYLLRRPSLLLLVVVVFPVCARLLGITIEMAKLPSSMSAVWPVR
jgi:hypothetical protein